MTIENNPETENAEADKMPPPYDRRPLLSSPASQTWLISFTDIIALMLTFFVMIFSMINPERSIMASISFSLHENESYGGTEAGGESHAAPAQRLEARAGKDLTYLAAVLTRNLQDHPSLSEARITQDGEFLKIILPQSLLFSSGRFDVREDVGPALGEIFNLLGSLRNRIEIYGYSDPVPVSRPRADFLTNWGLSQQRAASVAAMIYQSGYRSSIALYGLGVDNRAAGQGDDMTAAAMARSRRVEILIHKNR